MKRTEPRQFSPAGALRTDFLSQGNILESTPVFPCAGTTLGCLSDTSAFLLGVLGGDGAGFAVDCRSKTSAFLLAGDDAALPIWQLSARMGCGSSTASAFLLGFGKPSSCCRWLSQWRCGKPKALDAAAGSQTMCNSAAPTAKGAQLLIELCTTRAQEFSSAAARGRAIAHAEANGLLRASFHGAADDA
eukprot:Skav216093  [mRNA]  locus=scaffold2042:217704:218774:+ [translate_table: standard]